MELLEINRYSSSSFYSSSVIVIFRQPCLGITRSSSFKSFRFVELGSQCRCTQVIYPLGEAFYFIWHRHRIVGKTGAEWGKRNCPRCEDNIVWNSFSDNVKSVLIGYDVSPLPGNPPFDMPYHPHSINAIINLFILLNYFETGRQLLIRKCRFVAACLTRRTSKCSYMLCIQITVIRVSWFRI